MEKEQKTQKFVIPDKPYKDWFGAGNLKQDIEEEIKDHGEPDQIYISGYQACLVYKDKIIITGYDGNEYRVGMEFNTGDLL